MRLRIGGQVLASDAGDGALAEAIEAANARHRLDGVPDTLNPAIIDPAKAARFVAALPSQDAKTLARLAGHELPLDDVSLGLAAAAPTVAEAFARAALVIEEIRGPHVLAHTDAPPDAALARSRAADARAAVAAAEAAVQRAEKALSGDAIDPARRRRATVAQAWRLNAAAWAAAAPDDRAAQDELAAARAAARAYAMPTGGLAP